MAWNDYGVSQYGISAPPPTSQATPLQLANMYASGGVPATSLSGQVVNTLQVGGQSNPDLAVYIDDQGIHIGNAVFSAASFSVDMNGRAVITEATVQSSSGSQKVVIDSQNNEIEFFDSTGTLAGFIVGNLGTDGMGHNVDTLLIQSSASLGSALKMIWTDDATGQSSVFLDGYGGTPNVNINAQTNPGNSSSVDVAAGSIEVASTGPISYLPNGISVAPTVSGSIGGNTALQGLVSTLASLGLIIDGTTP